MRHSLLKFIPIVLTMCALIALAMTVATRERSTPSQAVMMMTTTTLSCEQPGELLVQTLTQGSDDHPRALSARLETMMALTGALPQRWHISHDQRTKLAHINPSALPAGLKLTELACAQDQYSLRVDRQGQQTPLWLTLRAKSPALIWIDDQTVVALEVRGPEAAPATKQGRWLLHQALAMAISNLNIN